MHKTLIALFTALSLSACVTTGTGNTTVDKVVETIRNTCGIIAGIDAIRSLVVAGVPAGEIVAGVCSFFPMNVRTTQRALPSSVVVRGVRVPISRR
jgi:hypothetical protein